MQYRIDKISGNKLSVLGLGCMRFPGILGRTDLPKTEEMIMRSIETGLNYFDTAWMYPGSEEALGAILDRNNAREKVFIATKLPLIACKTASDFNKFFNQSLERLKTKTVDYYFMHSMTDAQQWKKLKSWGIEEWIQSRKKSGQIKQAGFSFHGSANEFHEILDDYDWECCLIQLNYSDENFQAGVKGLRSAARKMPVMIMEPLLGGKLATGLPKGAEKIFRKAGGSGASGEALSPAGWALNWVWDHEEVTLLLSGMSNMAQMEENLRLADASAAGMLGETEKAVYSDVLKYIRRACKIGCTGCGYCMPCPKGVNIPGCFSSYNTMHSLGYVAGMQQFITSTGLTSQTGSSPGLCVKCGKCESHCPQKIPIMKDIVTVKKRMEPWWVKLIGVCFRAFFGAKRKK